MKYHISGAKINKCFDFAKYLGRFFGSGSETAWKGGDKMSPGTAAIRGGGC